MGLRRDPDDDAICCSFVVCWAHARGAGGVCDLCGGSRWRRCAVWPGSERLLSWSTAGRLQHPVGGGLRLCDLEHYQSGCATSRAHPPRVELWGTDGCYGRAAFGIPAGMGDAEYFSCISDPAQALKNKQPDSLTVYQQESQNDSWFHVEASFAV
jgi:hypothetical protein